jgi:NAD(P)-dependent dehydrogenase (short-subunit alcohol dehydrogenase family)
MVVWSSALCLHPGFRHGKARRLTPADAAAAVAFLVTDGAAALTGQTLITDGGLVFH